MTATASVAGVASLVGRAVVPVAQVVLWMFVYVSLLLGGWVAVGCSVGGWSPFVVTSGSMEPTLGVGDVLLVETGTLERVAQRSVIVFERGGERIAHRVFAVEADGYVTRGDANAAPDTDRVRPDDVIGDGRLVVPLVGLPAVWADEGNLAALAAWAVLSVVGAGRIGLLTVARLRRRAGPSAASASDLPSGMAVAQRAVRRVRTLVALLIAVHYLLEPARFEVLGGRGSSLVVMLAAVATAAGTNLFSRLGAAGRFDARVVMATELALDTLLVVALATLTGAEGIGWVLFALPIIEAAVRFRLAGALLHWMLLTAIVLVARIWATELIDAPDLLTELESVLDQLSVLFLVVVPGAHLVEQLVADVTAQTGATRRAFERGTLLERVAEAGRDMSRLGGEHVAAIIEGTRRLGFDAADVVVGVPGAGAGVAGAGVAGGLQWRSIGAGGAALPPPGAAGSGLRPCDLTHRAVLVDREDEEPTELAALDAHGLDALVAHTVSADDGRVVVLRAAVAGGGRLSVASLDALQLLAGQATVALRNDELLRELTTMHRDLEHQAHHDALTGLANRALLLKELTAALADQRARPALLFLDLNGFKPVNDRLGHKAGDTLLRLVAARLPGAIPPGSMVARLGGDEFTVLLQGAVSDEEAQRCADAVYEHVSSPYDLDGESVHVSTSIGIAFGDPGVDERELLRRADVAMYRAKHGSARRPTASYRPEFDHAEQRRARLIADIGPAIAADRLTLLYQPVYARGAAPAMRGVEALLRWNHELHGEIPAPEIVESARAADAGGRLTAWVLHEACRTAAGWLAGRELPFFVSVNASPEDLASQELAGAAQAALEVSGLAARHLLIEISERLVAPQAAVVAETVQALAAAGVGLLLDDFGEGQTSLSHIQSLPLSGIKLDRTLVVQAERSERDRIVLASVVELCHRLRLVVVAEGVETAAQLRIVSDLGADLLQGHYLAPAQPVAGITSLLGGGGRALRSGEPASLPTRRRS